MSRTYRQDRALEDSRIHDRIYEILNQKAALGLGEGEGDDYEYGGYGTKKGARKNPWLLHVKKERAKAKRAGKSITLAQIKRSYPGGKSKRKVSKRKVSTYGQRKRKVVKHRVTKRKVSARMGLKQMKVAELKALLKAAGDRGYSKLRKAQLVNRAIKLGL